MITFLITYRAYPFEFAMTLWGFFFYWLPLVLCLISYTAKCVEEYHEDISKRSGEHGSTYYDPKLTVGRIFGRFILAILPVVNLIAAAFHHLPRICSTVLNIPLVPDSKEYKGQRSHRNH